MYAAVDAIHDDLVAIGDFIDQTHSHEGEKTCCGKRTGPHAPPEARGRHVSSDQNCAGASPAGMTKHLDGRAEIRTILTAADTSELRL
jgi:hypothetical protein